MTVGKGMRIVLVLVAIAAWLWTVLLWLSENYSGSARMAEQGSNTAGIATLLIVLTLGASLVSLKDSTAKHIFTALVCSCIAVALVSAFQLYRASTESTRFAERLQTFDLPATFRPDDVATAATSGHTARLEHVAKVWTATAPHSESCDELEKAFKGWWRESRVSVDRDGDRNDCEFIGIHDGIEASAVVEDGEAVVEMWLPYADDE